MPRWRKFCRYDLDLLQLTAADAEQELDEMEIIQANRDKKRRKSDFFYVVVAAFVVVLGYGLMQLLTPDFSQNSRAMEQASNSVVAVNCFDQAGNLVAGGSGFLAFEPGIIVTNLHLAQMGYEIIAITKQGEKFLVNMVINYDADKDIVLLRSSELYLYDDENLQLLQPGPNQLTQQDDIVVAISSDQSADIEVAIGAIRAISPNSPTQLLQFAAKIGKNSVGGALFNQNGQVIAIIGDTVVDSGNCYTATWIEAVEKIYQHSNYYDYLTMPQFFAIGLLPKSMQ